MATARHLTGVGMPPALAALLGTDEPVEIRPGPDDQAAAALVTGNFAWLFMPGDQTPGVYGVRVKSAGLAGIHALHNSSPVGFTVNVYPNFGESFNGGVIDRPFMLDAGTTALLVPGGGGAWMVIKGPSV